LAYAVADILRGLVLYVPKESPVYKLHPSTKLFMVAVLSFCTLTTHSLYVAGPLLALVVLIVVLAKIPLSSLKVYTMVIGWLLMVSFVIYTVFTPVTSGTVLYRYGMLMVGLDNLLAWLLVAMKWFAASYITAVLLVTTKQRDIVLGLRAWKVPYIVCFIASSILRQLAVVSVDFFTATEAQMSRGLDFKQGSLFTRLSRFVRVGIPLLFVSFKRMEEMSNAMQSRAFKPTGRRTTYSTIRMKTSDALVMGALSALAFIVVWATYFGTAFPYRIG